MKRAVLRFVTEHPGLSLVLAGFYLLSPVDLLPESMLGPLGLVDDFIVLLLAVVLPSVLKSRQDGRRPQPPAPPPDPGGGKRMQLGNGGR